MAGSFLIIGEIDKIVRRVSIAVPRRPRSSRRDWRASLRRDPPEHGNHFIDPVGPKTWADCGPPPLRDRPATRPSHGAGSAGPGASTEGTSPRGLRQPGVVSSHPLNADSSVSDITRARCESSSLGVRVATRCSAIVLSLRSAEATTGISMQPSQAPPNVRSRVAPSTPPTDGWQPTGVLFALSADPWS